MSRNWEQRGWGEVCPPSPLGREASVPPSQAGADATPV